jgi:DNA-binding NarL/FixJ family response regulator
VEELESLLLDALDELLETARLSTIETWCELAFSLRITSPAFSLARSESALRYGRLAEAQAHAEEVATIGVDSHLIFRALAVAGRAAHLASREEEALELYRQAEDAAETEAARRDARWGQAICLVELERPEAIATLELLWAEARLSDPREFIRAAGCTLSYRLLSGPLDLADADRAAELLPALTDPLVESAFRSVYSNSLALAARYEDALLVAEALLVNARRYRLDFAIPYGLCAAAISHAGLRHWIEADRQARAAERAARARHDAHAEQFCFAVRLRALAQQGKHRAGLALKIPDVASALPASRAEVMSARALMLALAGRFEEARNLVGLIRGSTRALEPAVCIAAVEAIVSLRRHEHGAIDRVIELEQTTFETGAEDLLVTAYRSTPELLAVLLRASRHDQRIVELIRKAHDEDLADAVGHPIAADTDPRMRLSRREGEVFELLRQGLTNRQIAELLFISESTVKVHVHHVYDKLGVRSRTALTVQAVLERSDQATSAIERDDVVDDS